MKVSPAHLDFPLPLRLTINTGKPPISPDSVQLFRTPSLLHLQHGVPDMGTFPRIFYPIVGLYLATLALGALVSIRSQDPEGEPSPSFKT